MTDFSYAQYFQKTYIADIKKNTGLFEKELKHQSETLVTQSNVWMTLKNKVFAKIIYCW